MHRVLVIGTGSIGERHVRCLQRTGRADVAICEPNASLRERVAKEYRIGQAFESLEAAMEQAWDTAVVATPAPTHVSIARTLVRAGVAPLIEKPLAVEMDGVTDLLAEVNERSLVAGVAYVYRAHPALRAMRDAIGEGRIGRPLQIVATAGQHFPTYRPAYAQTYYARHASGGGAVQDALTHVLNAGEWLVGPVTALTADAAHQRLPNVDVEDTVHVLTRHEAVLGNYSLNQHQAPNEITMTVIGDGGTARFELHKHRWLYMAEPDTPWIEGESDKLETRDDWFTAQESAWLDAVEGKAEASCPLEAGLQTLRVNRAVLSSIASRQWVDLPQEIRA